MYHALAKLSQNQQHKDLIMVLNLEVHRMNRFLQFYSSCLYFSPTVLYLLVILLGCEVTPPTVTLKVNLDDCLNTDINNNMKQQCFKSISDQYRAVPSGTIVGCLSFSQNNQTQVADVRWENEEFNYQQDQLLLDVSLPTESHFVLYTPMESIRCSVLAEEYDEVCENISQCILKLDGTAYPTMPSSSSYYINFTQNGICQGTYNSDYLMIKTDDTIADGRLENTCVNSIIREEFCTVGVGLCKADGLYIESSTGIQICDATPFPPQIEYCGTGLDEDCDERIDEGFTNFGTTCELSSENETIMGIIDCTADRLGLECKIPDNTCDGQDNDLDGRIDEGYLAQEVDCERGSCSEKGYLRCINGQIYSTCATQTPTTENEICDGFDNDCDGNVDEGIQPQEVSCGLGPCRADGRIVCVNGAFQEVCTPGQASEEICNMEGMMAEDEDCDGTINEGFDPQMCPICPVNIVPSIEICDGTDNDCDGKTDEELLNRCMECGELPEEVCDGDDNDCNGLVDEGLLNACGFCGELPEEVCDEFDNDCDGIFNENVGMLSANQAGVCAGAETICVAGALVEPNYSTRPDYQNPETLCDGKDNDCDGRVDEESTSQNIPNLQGVCEGQRITCMGGTLVNPSYESIPDYESPETSCHDELDNDCDGLTDLEDVDCACSQSEICDGLDNDCDNIIDENAAENTNDEICDTIDNNCDGNVDESSDCQAQIRNLYKISIAWQLAESSTELPTFFEIPSFTDYIALAFLSNIQYSNQTANSVLKDDFRKYHVHPQDYLGLQVELSSESSSDSAWHTWMVEHQCQISLAIFDAGGGKFGNEMNDPAPWECTQVNIDQPLTPIPSVECMSVPISQLNDQRSTYFVSRYISMMPQRFGIGLSCNLLTLNQTEISSLDRLRFDSLSKSLSLEVNRQDPAVFTNDDEETYCIIKNNAEYTGSTLNPQLVDTVQKNSWISRMTYSHSIGNSENCKTVLFTIKSVPIE